MVEVPSRHFRIPLLISCTYRLAPRCHDFATRRLALRSLSVDPLSPSPPVPPPGSPAPPPPIAAVLPAPGPDAPDAPTGRLPGSISGNDRLQALSPARSDPG